MSQPVLFKNRTIYLTAVRYRRGFQDGFQPGIYCRTREVMRQGKNVAFIIYKDFDSTAEARRAGFRICKRPVAYIDTKSGREYIDESYMIINPAYPKKRFTVNWVKFNDAYEPADEADLAEFKAEGGLLPERQTILGRIKQTIQGVLPGRGETA